MLFSCALPRSLTSQIEYQKVLRAGHRGNAFLNFILAVDYLYSIVFISVERIFDDVLPRSRKEVICWVNPKLFLAHHNFVAYW